MKGIKIIYNNIIKRLNEKNIDFDKLKNLIYKIFNIENNKNFIIKYKKNSFENNIYINNNLEFEEIKNSLGNEILIIEIILIDEEIFNLKSSNFQEDFFLTEIKKLLIDFNLNTQNLIKNQTNSIIEIINNNNLKDNNNNNNLKDNNNNNLKDNNNNIIINNNNIKDNNNYNNINNNYNNINIINSKEKSIPSKNKIFSNLKCSNCKNDIINLKYICLFCNNNNNEQIFCEICSKNHEHPCLQFNLQMNYNDNIYDNKENFLKFINEKYNKKNNDLNLVKNNSNNFQLLNNSNLDINNNKKTPFYNNLLDIKRNSLEFNKNSLEFNKNSLDIKLFIGKINTVYINKDKETKFLLFIENNSKEDIKDLEILIILNNCDNLELEYNSNSINILKNIRITFPIKIIHAESKNHNGTLEIYINKTNQMCLLVNFIICELNDADDKNASNAFDYLSSGYYIKKEINKDLIKKIYFEAENNNFDSLNKVINESLLI